VDTARRPYRSRLCRVGATTGSARAGADEWSARLQLLFQNHSVSRQDRVALALAVPLAVLAVAVGVADVVDGITLLTGALVLLTAYYAIQTRAMVAVMQQERQDAILDRRWQRVEIASRRLLAQFDAALTVSARGGAVVLHEQPDILAKLVDAIRDHDFEIDDVEMRRRLSVCLMAGQTATWPEQHLRDARTSAFLMFSLIQEARRSLQSYVKQEPLPLWPDWLPEVPQAQAWIIEGRTPGADREAE
jgi:hypothetical protein